MSVSDKLTREELERKVAEADALAEMKSNFLATMSHEIRTPMQTIYGILELIADEKPSPHIADMVQTAQSASSGLLEILDDILDLAKMDADRMELDMFEVPVRLLVQGLLEALSVKVHGIDIELIDHIEPDVPPVVIGDPKRLRQIIMNLCSNALKFTHHGSVTVRVSTKVQHIDISQSGIGLRFEITDTGIGMPQEVCDKLFAPFVQADNSTSRKYGGTGLGLSISKRLVELMDGKIGAESEKGKGSTFWFEIPTREVSIDESTVKLPSLDGISVISVEDHPQGAKEIVNSLRSMGAAVESCPTYKEGLALIKRRPFDVAVIDQGLPDGLGLDLIKEAGKIRPNMGLVMYTVRDDIGLSHSLKALGAKYLTKPASRAGLGEAVRDTANRTERLTIEGATKMLIAEDTPSVRNILTLQLNKLGLEADFVEDGLEALEALKTGEYGILISDLHMPKIDGYELVEKIREKEKDTDNHFPVIALTADVQMAQRETYLQYGFDECLLKPVSLGQFRRLLIRWGLLSTDTVPQDGASALDPGDNAGLPPAIDRAAMEEQLGAFDESAIEMLSMFVEMTAPQIAEIIEAFEARDMHDLRELGHSLKGAARSACCPVLGDYAGALQHEAEAGNDVSEIVENIQKEFERVRIEVSALKS